MASIIKGTEGFLFKKLPLDITISHEKYLELNVLGWIDMRIIHDKDSVCGLFILNRITRHF